LGKDDTANDSYDPTQYEVFDERPADADPSVLGFLVEQEPVTKRRTAVIRTTDRIQFRRCRRRWGWGSHLRGNLGPKENASPLWMGSGFHFALEDFHGAKRFPTASAAFDAFVDATKRHDKTSLPVDWSDLWELSVGMLDYYEHQWLRHRTPLQTFVFNGVPQVEVNFRVEIPFDASHWGYDDVVYSGTLDRVCIDEYGQLWIVEYKTAKSIQTLHLANDSQVSSYCWAGQYLYGQPIVGVIYQQHRKDLPKEPRLLANGRLSVDKSQLITASSFREKILTKYSRITDAPSDHVELLNYLVSQESPKGDKFVLRNYIQRNAQQCQAEGVKILMETEEMLNPDLPLYPNPDRTCQFMCPFNGPCVSMDDGSDWAYEMELLMKPREKMYDSWRKKVKYPDEQFAPMFGELPQPKLIDYQPVKE